MRIQKLEKSFKRSSLVFGGFGAYVAALQMFNDFYKSAYHEEFIYLSSCAFLILMARLLVTFKRQ